MTKPTPFSSAASGRSVPSAAGAQPPHREVRDEVEAEHPGEQRADVGRERRDRWRARRGCSRRRSTTTTSRPSESSDRRRWRATAARAIVTVPASRHRRRGAWPAARSSGRTRAWVVVVVVVVVVVRRRRWASSGRRTHCAVSSDPRVELVCDAVAVDLGQVGDRAAGALVDGGVPSEHAAGHALEDHDLVAGQADEVRPARVPTERRRLRSPTIRRSGSEHEQHAAEAAQARAPARAAAGAGGSGGSGGATSRRARRAAGSRSSLGIGRRGRIDLEHVDRRRRVMLSSPPASFAAATSASAGALRVGFAAGEALDVAVAHHRGEPVGAEQNAVAGLDVERVQVDVDVVGRRRARA